MLEDEKTENEQARRRENLRTLLRCFVIPAFSVIFLLKIVFSLLFIPTASMEPTIHKGILQFALRIPYLLGDPMPDRGEIIVFRNDGDHELLVKRVIGIAGDEVTLTEGTVSLNGQTLQELYLPEGTVTETVSRCVRTFKRSGIRTRLNEEKIMILRKSSI